jgi:hypothetical protein
MINRTNTNNPSNLLHFEVRKVQQQKKGRSLMVTLPNTYTKKKSPNNWTIYSGDNSRVLLERDGKRESETVYDGDGKVLRKRENKE